MDREEILETAMRKAARVFKRKGGRDDLEDYLQTCRLERLLIASKLESMTDDNAAAFLYRTCMNELITCAGYKTYVLRAPRIFQFRNENAEYFVQDRAPYLTKKEELRRRVMELFPRVCKRKHKRRAVVVTATLQGYGVCEIAKRMGVKHSTVIAARDQFVKAARKELELKKVGDE